LIFYCEIMQMDTFHDDIIYVIIKNNGPEVGLTCRKYYQFLLLLQHYLINTYNYAYSHQQDGGDTVKKYRTYGKKTIYESEIYKNFLRYAEKYDYISGVRVSIIVNEGVSKIINITNMDGELVVEYMKFPGYKCRIKNGFGYGKFVDANDSDVLNLISYVYDDKDWNINKFITVEYGVSLMRGWGW